MISCKDFIARLGSYLEEDVAADLRQALDQHLASCAACQVIVDSSKKTITILTGRGQADLTIPLPEALIARIMDRIRTPDDEPSCP